MIIFNLIFLFVMIYRVNHKICLVHVPLSFVFSKLDAAFEHDIFRDSLCTWRCFWLKFCLESAVCLGRGV